MSSSAVRFAALVVACAAACEGGSTFPPSDMSFEQFCPAWETAVEAIYARCDNAPGDALNLEACDSLAARLVSGRMTFDRSMAAGCLRDWQTASCDMLHRREIFACSSVLVGTVDADGACATGFECTGDLTCDFSAGVCPGTCRAPLAAGSACGDPTSPSCDSGTSCVDEPGGAHCRALVGQGGACGPGVGDCDAFLGCVAAPGGAPGFVCQPERRVGDACAGLGDVCPSYAPCAPSGVCTLTPIAAAGSACTVGTRCTAATACVAGACVDCR